MKELIGFTSTFFRQFERSLQKDLLFRKELTMKPKCLACGDELTDENRDDDYDNFCVSCVEGCTPVELLSMETPTRKRRIDDGNQIGG